METILEVADYKKNGRCKLLIVSGCMPQRYQNELENELPEATNAMQEIFPHTGNAYTVGFTGPPGAGKSTLVDKVTLHLCQQGKKIGIVAIDPSSPFSGGAILGDRIASRASSTPCSGSAPSCTRPVSATRSCPPP